MGQEGRTCGGTGYQHRRWRARWRCAEGAGQGILPGTSGWVSITLEPGRYELVCNLPGHYAAGMYTQLTVT